MAAGFSTIAFKVVTDDGWLPRPQAFHDRPHVYAATIELTTTALLDTLDGLLSRVTEKPALGRRAGKVVADFGTIANLTIPVDNGTEEVWTARLIDLVPTAWGRGSGHVRAEATWLCLDRTSPA